MAADLSRSASRDPRLRLWAAWGLLISDRSDGISVPLFLLLPLLLPLLRCHPVMAPLLPTIVCFTSSWELTGARMGAWTYASHDVTGLLSFGHPPAAIAGGYALPCYGGLVLASLLLTIWREPPAGATRRGSKTPIAEPSAGPGIGLPPARPMTAAGCHPEEDQRTKP